ncbi:WYL domain-containing protein [Hoyosella sp. G463]|uniref:WYL domain-containing protein n=1 Tax=Lolliginicoccus lacisalsi TaxID=2742202 RepID=A0A927PMQ0_9ACTN|nr:WYL domain-containing protein [Lolliginicoccus lacisalsi]MBD8506902.1 WYL domain-containing protein [Lolliginicoccus lacisalsi]
MASSRLSVKLVRLLNLVPYVMANPGISKADLAREMGVTQKELVDDLNLLWMCGLPGYGPGDLIDLSFEGETVAVTYAAGMERPLRLAGPEATALLVALRALLDQPGMADPAAVRRAIAKIESAAGVAASSNDNREPGQDEQASAEPGAGDPAAGARLAVVREAVRRKRALSIVYYSASRDVVSERVADPMGMLLVDDQAYLQAWCRMAEDVRLFRLDRIESARLLDQPARIPADAQRATADGLFSDHEHLGVARLVIEPSAGWFVDYYPVENEHRLDDGRVQVEMRYASDEWMARMLLGFGASITVVGPAGLAQRMRQQAEAGLERYRQA